MILFFDDEKRWVRNHIAELERRELPLTVCSTFESAIEQITSLGVQIRCAILDIMAPSNQPERTDGGLITGLLVYQTLRNKQPTCPVYFLTNLPDDARVRAVAKNDPLVAVRPKDKANYDELADEVEKAYRAQFKGRPHE